MLDSKVRFLLVAASFAAFGTWLVGCGGVTGPATEPVTGVVTLDGTPVDGAKVVFTPTTAEGRAAAGVTDATGKYELTTFNPADGAMLGQYKISVSKTKAERLEVDLEGLSPKEADMAAAKAFYGGGGQKRAMGKMGGPAAEHLLPQKYSSVATSGLSYTVAKGDNTYDIALTSGE